MKQTTAQKKKSPKQNNKPTQISRKVSNKAGWHKSKEKKRRKKQNKTSAVSIFSKYFKPHDKKKQQSS